MAKQTFEQTGLIPRSIIRTFDRFRKQLLPGAEIIVIQEFRNSRNQVLVSVKCLINLIVIPFLVNCVLKISLLMPFTEHLWNTYQNDIFLNSYQQDRAFKDMQDFEDKLYFEFLITNPYLEKNISFKTQTLKRSEFTIQQKFQEKTAQLALYYNQQSIEALTNLFADFITLGTISLLLIWMKSQIITLKSFLTESIYSLSDTTKSFLLILGTDLLVGFHSPHGWEIFIEILLRHFGLPENQEFIFLFVATFPVLLDTVFKYWIFRYLNQISPSTVATYHSMIE